MPDRRALLAVVPLLLASSVAAVLAQEPAAPLAVRVTLAPAAAEAMARLGLEPPYDGRLLVVASRDSADEPRLQTGVAGVPFWGRDVAGWTPGVAETLADGPGVLGYPLERLADLPPGTYFVQALFNVYTTFPRADGRVVKLHAPTGEGQDLWRSPGNVTSPVVRVEVGAGGPPVQLVLSRVLPPIEPVPAGGVLMQGNPADGRLVKFVKLRSQVLSRFWGRDIYIGANVLLPRSWHDAPEARFPLIVSEGHFPGRRAPFGFTEDTAATGRGAAFRDFWLSAEAPEVLAMSIRDANPYYDTSYAIDSPNVGPYGTAITTELIPYVERTFRGVAEPWARVVAGGSTGGWEALALQIFNPAFFGGAWGWCPDPVDFRYHQIVNVYEDRNAYWLQRGDWLQVPRPGSRRPDGNVQYTMANENLYELAAGPRSRSGGQWAIWEAAYGPVGEDGYPRPIWNPVTGEIDHATAAWWREHTDLRAKLEREWPQVAPLLQGKLHVAVGDMDSYYLEEAVYLLEEAMDGLDPPAKATFQYGRRQPHCFIGWSATRPGQTMDNAEFVRAAAAYMEARRPGG